MITATQKDFWEPREIIFTPEQVYWLLEHYLLLSMGRWPQDPRKTGYTELVGSVKAGKSKVRSRRAPFETPGQIKAEIDTRLTGTGVDGKLLMAEAQAGIGIMLLQAESKRVLMYIAGWRRKRERYSKWRWRGRY